MADHSKPTTTSTYTNFVSELDGRLDDLARGLDPANTTATNVPTNAIRWDSASKKWQKWSGTAWGDLSSEYAINLAAGSSISANTSSNAFRITQTGIGGNALLVEDSSNPDSTPFVIDASGRVINGYTASLSVGDGGDLGTQLIGASGSSGQTMARFDNNGSGARLQFLKSRNATPGSTTTVQSGDSLGSIAWYGDDGYANYAANGGVLAAFIQAYVDGTPDENKMPGRLVFSTATDASPSVLTERMLINSSGNVSVGTTTDYGRFTVANDVGGQFGRVVLDANVTSGYTASISATDNGMQLWAQSSSRGLTFNTGSTITERMRIDSSGDVGIGTSSPASILHIADPSPILTIQDTTATGTTYGGYIDFIDSADTRQGYIGFGSTTNGDLTIQSTDATGEVRFQTGGATERVRITSNGYLRMASGSGGIQFNNDTSANNALYDYEQGTWTPGIADALSGGNAGTIGSAYGHYTKVGNLVTVTVSLTNIDTTGMTAGNDLYITGLPYFPQSLTGTIYYAGACVLGNTTVANNPSLVIVDNNASIRIGETASGAAFDYMQVVEFTSGSADIYGTLTYQAV